MSSPSNVLSASFSAFFLSSLIIFSPKSLTVFSTWNTRLSVRFASHFFTTFLSASAFSSASFTMRSISSSDRDELDCIDIFVLLVPKSLAVTLTIPFYRYQMLLRFEVHPRGAGGMSVNWNLPKVLLSDAIGRSPCNT